RVLAFDVARAHVVGDGVAEDFSAWADEQGKLGFRHRPFGIASNRNLTARADHPVRSGFEEELRTFRPIDAVVEIAATGGLRFFHARVAAAMVSDAGGPDLLADDRGQEVRRLIGTGEFVHSRAEEVGEIIAGDQVVPGEICSRIPALLVFEDSALFGAIEFQRWFHRETSGLSTMP